MTSPLTLLFVSFGAVAIVSARQPCEPEWRPLGKGLPDSDYFKSMAVFDDGSGPALYVGGGFTVEQGAPANGVARWDGIAWSSVGGGGIEGDAG